MDVSNPKLPHLLLLLPFFHLLLFVSNTHAIPQNSNSLNKTVSALFVFGDSTADPGNNNYLSTPMKANFPPYGRDFTNHVPTGRFTNGRLANDFIISYLGIKTYVPPYLDPKLSINELTTGVSFASAGSGFDPLTPKITGVIPLPQQLEMFKEFKARIKKQVGENRTADLINNAAFLISAGTNDFVINYFTLPGRRLTFNVSDYQNFVLKQVKDFIQGLREQGARRIVVVGLPPLGCLPLVMTEFDPLGERHCLDKYSSVARDYNKLLQLLLTQIHSNQTASNLKLYYADIYGPLQDMIQNKKQYGFEEVSRGCCGTGYLEASILCNPESFLCPNASNYVFWDSIHPSEKTYEYIVKALQPLMDAIILEL